MSSGGWEGHRDKRHEGKRVSPATVAARKYKKAAATEVNLGETTLVRNSIRRDSALGKLGEIGEHSLV